jgi:prepilin-type processing-associated H-X9-DG protein
MTRPTRAFAMVELLVVIAIVAVLGSMLLPALSKSRNTAYSLLCASSQRQIGIADQAYRNDWKFWFVPSVDHVELLAAYTGTDREYYKQRSGSFIANYRYYRNAHPFKCPLVRPGETYFINGGAKIVSNVNGITDYSIATTLHHPSLSAATDWKRDSELIHTPSTVLNFADALTSYRLDYSTFSVEFRHYNDVSANLLYVDGHSASVTYPGLSPTSFNRGANNTSTTTWAQSTYFWF